MRKPREWKMRGHSIFKCEKETILASTGFRIFNADELRSLLEWLHRTEEWLDSKEAN